MVQVPSVVPGLLTVVEPTTSSVNVPLVVSTPTLSEILARSKVPARAKVTGGKGRAGVATRPLDR